MDAGVNACSLLSVYIIIGVPAGACVAVMPTQSQALQLTNGQPILEIENLTFNLAKKTQLLLIFPFNFHLYVYLLKVHDRRVYVYKSLSCMSFQI